MRGDIPLLKEPTLKNSIHAARNAAGGNGGREEIPGSGRITRLVRQYFGMNRSGHGRGRGTGRGKGRGIGKW